VPALLAVSALFCFCSALEASDLRIDGLTYLPHQLMNDSVEVTVAGAPGFEVTLLMDLAAGPTTLFGQSLPLGFSEDLVFLPLGPIPLGGVLTYNVYVPFDPGRHDRHVYLLAVVHDPSFPHGLDFSNGADLIVKDRQVQLAGNSLAEFPFFEHVRAFNQGEPVELGLDPTRFPFVAGRSADIYVVAAKTKQEWLGDLRLLDVAGGPIPYVFAGGTIQANTLTLDPGTLSGQTGTAELGVGYDVVIDFNRDGLLNGRDLIDGFGDEAGFYVVHDLTLPGPYPVTEVLYNVGGGWGGQDLYYPTNVASLGLLPLVVVSHGNGHNYQWYDHIGYHLASYGYIVMSHQNNTVPGSGTAALTTLSNTELFLMHYDIIAGGALNHHVDVHNIVWIGHSRGGDGVVRAYDDIVDGDYTPRRFQLEDIKLISSIAPVDFGGFGSSHPHGANFHLWVGGADADVTGCAAQDTSQSFQLHDRAEQIRQSISLHGVGHGDFHDGGGGSVANGPCRVGRAQTHVIMRGYLLPLLSHHIRGNIPAKDFLWRQYERFHPIGAPVANPCVVADLMYRDGDASGKLVIDDFQSNASQTVSSSGGAVSFTVTEFDEGLLNDANNNFTYVVTDEFNGFTVSGNGDNSRGIVFSYDGGADQWLNFELPAGGRDLTRFEFLSFRAAQATRHPNTISDLGDTTFHVALIDGAGGESSIGIGAFGGGIEEPYQRTNCGTGAGWNNEFETIRIRLEDYQNNGAPLDLTDVRAVRFRFGPSFGTPSGRIGLDDLELTTD
jgi:hypothetical protein